MFSPRSSIFSLATLALALSGCGGSGPTEFQTQASTAAPAGTTPTPLPSTSPTAVPPVLSYSEQGQELVPLVIQLTRSTSNGTSFVVSGLPQGASFDSSTHILRWIPRRGQAGNYSITLQPQGGFPARTLRLGIQAMPDAQLASGPPALYQQGDVGYVFVHGAGDVNRCLDRANLLAYWAGGPAMLEPNASLVDLTCYDSTGSVAAGAPGVAQQIMSADCGTFNRCIVVTHSMGGLMMEHMFTHNRPAVSSDPVPSMFASYRLYEQVRERTLFVISLASAAGGSKVANIVDDPGAFDFADEVSGTLANWVGQNEPYTHNLDVTYASDTVAPMTVDTGVPFFLVGGYSTESVREAGTFLTGFDLVFSSPGDKVFNNNSQMAAIDLIADFNDRDDGLVDFRSSCGIQSDNLNWGPGDTASLATNLQYCSNGPRKPNHFVWFMTNLNHEALSYPFPGCGSPDNPCEARFPASGTYAPNPAYARLNAFQVMQSLLAPSASVLNRAPATVALDF